LAVVRALDVDWEDEDSNYCLEEIEQSYKDEEQGSATALTHQYQYSIKYCSTFVK
jgi:hypothetical protein